MRIISGKYKGKVLKSFEFNTTRPTLDRVKEAIFDKIFMKVRKGTILDLFGGTGGMGLEALSRGASSVYICDDSVSSINLIKKNCERFDEKPEILQLDYVKALELFNRTGTQFDIIFLDPPYDSSYGAKSLELIEKYELLKSDGIVVYEHDISDGFIYTGVYFKEEEKVYGRARISYMTIMD